MTREALSLLLGGGLIVCGTTFGCNSTGALQRPPQQVPNRVAPSSAPELASIDVSFTAGPGEPEESLPEAEVLGRFADETIVAVDEDTVSDAAQGLHFQPARRRGETVGMRVFFADGEEDGDDGTYLGLRRTDRIEEIDGLTIAALGQFLELWRGVGKKPEVRLLLNREGRAHTVVYRRRYVGTARGY